MNGASRPLKSDNSRVEPMRNRTLHRRLTVIEAKSDQVANVIERERMSMAERKLSVDEAERAYKRFKESCSNHARSKELSKLTLDELTALYFREVRRTTAPQRRRTQPDGQ